MLSNGTMTVQDRSACEEGLYFIFTIYQESRSWKLGKCVMATGGPWMLNEICVIGLSSSTHRCLMHFFKPITILDQKTPRQYVISLSTYEVQHVKCRSFDTVTYISEHIYL